LQFALVPENERLLSGLKLPDALVLLLRWQPHKPSLRKERSNVHGTAIAFALEALRLD